MSLLYEAETKGLTGAEVVAALPVAPEPYAADLVLGTSGAQARIDAIIVALAEGWKLERMPALDRAVLRMAIWELLERPDVPTAVVINEAVELAKRFSTDNSGKFVNGVLSRAAREIRPTP
jgi:N utilization substance protein B